MTSAASTFCMLEVHISTIYHSNISSLTYTQFSYSHWNEIILAPTKWRDPLLLSTFREISVKSRLFVFVNLTKYLQMSVFFTFFRTAQCCNLLNSKEKCGWKALYSIYIVLGNFKGDFFSAFSLHLEFSCLHLESVRNIPISAEKS